MEEIQPGIYRENDYLYTVNADPGKKVYGEPLISREGKEFRRWDPGRSKAGAAVINGIDLEVEEDDRVLYLGAASGTTVSHFSDILQDGFIYAVEYSQTTARDLLKLAESRQNIAPILGDARKPGDYSDIVDEVDVVFQDISQRDQAEIFLRNCGKYLADDGTALIAIKAQSVSSSRDPEEVFGEVKEKLQEELEIVEETRLEPYETDHLFVKLKKKK